jgi:5-methylcytosine-specific restriction endonuclease McrA
MSSRQKIPKATRRQVAEQANYRCNYCRSPEWAGVPMVVDHVVPLAAGGTSNIENLCLACYRCNEFKGPKSDALDPLSDKQVSLFKPNVQL